MHIYRLQIHALARLIALAVISVSISFSGISCVSQYLLDPHGENAPQAPTAFTGLPPLARLASASGDFSPFQNGADFAADLDYSRCAPSGTSADLTPDYAAPNQALSDAAYCLYRLELDPAAASAALTLAWNGAAPAGADCWVGLSNWGRDGWDWQQLTSNPIDISSPATYGDAAKHCYLALVVLGATQVELASISFGAPPPPSNGYTLFTSQMETTNWLIDESGTVVHSWVDQGTPPLHHPGFAAMLAEDGYLWRQVKITNQSFQFGGAGGRLEKVAWDGTVVWFYVLSTDTQDTHHDFRLMPNGNVLLTVWNKYTFEDATAAGRDPSGLQGPGLYVDSIVEIQPIGVSEANIVWQWNVMDHLIQNYDNSKGNYGEPAEHPELINFNYNGPSVIDWTHINAVDYSAALDQVVVSVHGFSELWVIDHSTTTAEAAGHSGGKYGHGGDLLYRWGNPQAYGAGTAADQKLSGQHDVHWIKAGLTGAGDLLILNNRAGTAPDYSAVVEITPPVNPDGSYYMTGKVFGPDAPVWQYIADPPGLFYSQNLSSAQRLPDGNTLICKGDTGNLFEVTPAGETVWEHQAGATTFRAIRYPSDYPGLANLP